MRNVLNWKSKLLDDPFLFEAIQGFHEADSRQSQFRLKNIQKQVRSKTEKKSRRRVLAIVIQAAAFGLIMVAFVFGFQYFNGMSADDSNEIIVENLESGNQNALDVQGSEIELNAIGDVAEQGSPTSDAQLESLSSNDREDTPVTPSKSKQFKGYQNTAVEFEEKSESENLAATAEEPAYFEDAVQDQKKLATEKTADKSNQNEAYPEACRKWNSIYFWSSHRRYRLSPLLVR